MTATYPIYKYPVLIQEHHLDTFGHVNNAKYLELFEDARWDLITNNGYGMEVALQKKIGPVILSVDLQFKKELHNREKIIITTQTISYSGKIGKLLQSMVKENNDIACTGLFTFGLFDLKTRKLIEPTSEWLKAIGLSPS